MPTIASVTDNTEATHMHHVVYYVRHQHTETHEQVYISRKHYYSFHSNTVSAALSAIISQCRPTENRKTV
jgi:hypothetical protein